MNPIVMGKPHPELDPVPEDGRGVHRSRDSLGAGGDHDPVGTPALAVGGCCVMNRVVATRSETRIPHVKCGPDQENVFVGDPGCIGRTGEAGGHHDSLPCPIVRVRRSSKKNRYPRGVIHIVRRADSQNRRRANVSVSELQALPFERIWIQLDPPRADQHVLGGANQRGIVEFINPDLCDGRRDRCESKHKGNTERGRNRDCNQPPHPTGQDILVRGINTQDANLPQAVCQDW